MLSPIAGTGFRGGIGFPIGGGGVPSLPSLGANLPGGCGCGGGDGFLASSELLQGTQGSGLSPFAGLAGGALGHPGFSGGGLSHPGFSDLSSMHPWAGGLPDESLPPSLMGGGDPVAGFASLLGGPDPAAGFASLLSGGGQGAFPALGTGGSLANQALLAQAAAGDQNQAALIGAQSGAYGGLAGAQGMALGGINPLMSGLMANYG